MIQCSEMLKYIPAILHLAAILLGVYIITAVLALMYKAKYPCEHYFEFITTDTSQNNDDFRLIIAGLGDYYFFPAKIDTTHLCNNPILDTLLMRFINKNFKDKMLNFQQKTQIEHIDVFLCTQNFNITNTKFILDGECISFMQKNYVAATYNLAYNNKHLTIKNKNTNKLKCNH